jgi:hypothetical protein
MERKRLSVVTGRLRENSRALEAAEAGEAGNGQEGCD